MPQVDDRLAGEGTGKIFGINDPAVFWAIAIAFTTVWGVFYVSTRCAAAAVGRALQAALRCAALAGCPSHLAALLWLPWREASAIQPSPGLTVAALPCLCLQRGR